MLADRLAFRAALYAATGLAALSLALRAGRPETAVAGPPALHAAVTMILAVLVAFEVGSIFRRGRAGARGGGPRSRLRRVLPEDLLLAAALVLAALGVLPHSLSELGSLLLLRQTIALGTRAGQRAGRVSRIANAVHRRPGRMLALTFLCTILFGTVMLTDQAATADGLGAPALDALFTATSATCVTGLIVRDTPVYFSRFGQVVILLLIQVGALGIMTLSASLAVAFGRRLGLDDRAKLGSVLEQTETHNLITLTKTILTMTFLFEGLGAIPLALRFTRETGSAAEGIWLGVFHSVSAFCNAGFSLFSDNLESWSEDGWVLVPVAALITVGGLGFAVMHDLWELRWKLGRARLDPLRRRDARLTLHSKLVLLTSGALLVVGALVFLLFEGGASLAGRGFGSRLGAAIFQSVTARTAGFNTVPFGELRDVTLFVTATLMFVGASPGSTGGGIKTSTLAILVLSMRSILQGREEVEVFRRTVSKEDVYRATAVTVIAGLFVVGYIIVLRAVQPGRFIDVFFETTSAFGTVGLSTGLTPLLTAPGKALIILMMFVGRLGPLTLALAVGKRRTRARYRYPTGRVMVG
jgi:trk system potassium uptake protein TrkH